MLSGRYYEKPDSVARGRHNNDSFAEEADDPVRSAANTVKVKTPSRSAKSIFYESDTVKDYLTEDQEEGRRSGKWRWIWWSVLFLGVLMAGVVIIVICKMLIWNNHSSNGSDSGDSNSTTSASPAIARLCNFTENPPVCQLTLTSQPGANSASDEELVTMVVSVAHGIVSAARGLFDGLNGTDAANRTLQGVAQSCFAMLDHADDFMNSTLTAVQALLHGQETYGNFADILQHLSAAVTLNDDCLIDLKPFANSSDPRISTAYNQVKNGELALINAFSLVRHLPNISSIVASLLDSAELALSTNGTLANALANLSPVNRSEIPADLDAVNAPGTADPVDSRRRRHLLWEAEDDEDAPRWARRGLTELTAPTVDIIVDQSGRGNFRTIQAAVNSIPIGNKKRCTIKIRAGVYRENVIVPKKKDCISFVGDGARNTFIVGKLSVIKSGVTTYDSATLGVNGQEFWMMDVAVINEAGPEGQQAVAFRCSSDLSVIYRCAFRGFQDTLYTQVGRQYYLGVIVEGTIDFIFGNAALFIHRSNLNVRWNGQKSGTATVTAQGRMIRGQPTGTVLMACRIRLRRRLLARTKANPAAFPSYLGRPWKEYSAVTLVNCLIQEGLKPEGWLDWNGVVFNTVSYYEYGSFGSGFVLGVTDKQRVRWSKQINFAQANMYSLQRFLGASRWLPRTGVPYK